MPLPILVIIMATTLLISLPQAVEWLLARWPEADLETLRTTPRDELIDHHLGLGLRTRNELDLWNERSDLRAACSPSANRDETSPPPVHPDDASQQILEALWERLQERR